MSASLGLATLAGTSSVQLHLLKFGFPLFECLPTMQVFRLGTVYRLCLLLRLFGCFPFAALRRISMRLAIEDFVNTVPDQAFARLH